MRAVLPTTALATVQVWISDEYNGILSDVTNYQVLSIQEFLSINDGVANPYDTNSLLGTPLEELTWSDIRPISIETTLDLRQNREKLFGAFQMPKEIGTLIALKNR